jgi:hypothetical protein
MKYDKAYFIAKFEAIPDSEIGTGSVSHRCASYYCGLREGMADHVVNSLPELNALGELLRPTCSWAPKTATAYGVVWRVNDGDDWGELAVLSPRARILAALHDLP